MTKQRVIVPFSQRPLDWLFVLFFVINLLVITYIVDLEGLVISDPSNFAYPLWPPKFWIDIIHWYGRTFDPILIARPVFWKVTLWWDALFFGPYYALALYAFIKGRDWIRDISIIYSSAITVILTVILADEVWGLYPAINLPFVFALNLPWLLIPLLLLLRMLKTHHPFTRVGDSTPKKKQ